ncbi:hypothetical protein STEG23_029468 [Scotinomys teguina]
MPLIPVFRRQSQADLSAEKQLRPELSETVVSEKAKGYVVAVFSILFEFIFTACVCMHLSGCTYALVYVWRPEGNLVKSFLCFPLYAGSTGQEKEGNLDMEELHGENEGKLEKEGKPEDEVESEDEEKSDGEKKPDKKAKPARQGKLEEGAKPGEQGQPQDEGKSEKQGKSEGEGKRQGEGKQDSQAKAASEARAAEKRPAEDYVPRKAKRKTDRGTDDSPKDSQEDLQDRHRFSPWPPLSPLVIISGTLHPLLFHRCFHSYCSSTAASISCSSCYLHCLVY